MSAKLSLCGSKFQAAINSMHCPPTPAILHPNSYKVSFQSTLMIQSSRGTTEASRLVHIQLNNFSDMLLASLKIHVSIQPERDKGHCATMHPC